MKAAPLTAAGPRPRIPTGNVQETRLWYEAPSPHPMCRRFARRLAHYALSVISTVDTKDLDGNETGAVWHLSVSRVAPRASDPTQLDVDRANDEDVRRVLGTFRMIGAVEDNTVAAQLDGPNSPARHFWLWNRTL